MVNYKDLGLVNTREMFKRAYEEGYAIGAFNVNNMEIVHRDYSDFAKNRNRTTPQTLSQPQCATPLQEARALPNTTTSLRLWRAKSVRRAEEAARTSQKNF